ncbi:hypothetical protein HDK64DRAFT_46549 [Phyllosticta capitalensis]
MDGWFGWSTGWLFDQHCLFCPSTLQANNKQKDSQRSQLVPCLPKKKLPSPPKPQSAQQQYGYPEPESLTASSLLCLRLPPKTSKVTEEDTVYQRPPPPTLVGPAVRTARSGWLPQSPVPLRVAIGHALPNPRRPSPTRVGWLAGWLAGGPSRLSQRKKPSKPCDLRARPLPVAAPSSASREQCQWQTYPGDKSGGRAVLLSRESKKMMMMMMAGRKKQKGSVGVSQSNEVDTS